MPVAGPHHRQHLQLGKGGHVAIVEAEGAPGIDGLGLPAGDSGKQGIRCGPAVLQGLSGCGQDLHGVLGVTPGRLHAHAMVP